MAVKHLEGQRSTGQNTWRWTYLKRSDANLLKQTRNCLRRNKPKATWGRDSINATCPRQRINLSSCTWGVDTHEHAIDVERKTSVASFFIIVMCSFVSTARLLSARFQDVF